MPENETLEADSKTALRFRRCRDRLDAGQTSLAELPEIEHQLYKTLAEQWKQWKRCGVEPLSMFQAALGDRQELGRLFERIHRNDFAKFLVDASFLTSHVGLEPLIRDWLHAVWGWVRDIVQLDRHPASQSTEFKDRVEEVLERIAQGLAKNPNKVPRRRRRDEPPPDLNDLLNEPLL
jgi:hypothetical protein